MVLKSFTWVLIILWIKLSKASNCNLVINEINTDVSSKLENKEFIELKLIYPENAIPFTDLSNYKVIVIDHKNNGQPIINVVIDLDTSSLNENQFFTIGGQEIPESNIKVPSTKIMSRHFFNSKQLSNLFPNCNILPCGIALLYRISKLNSLILTEQQRYITFHIYWKNLVKDTLIDLFVYGRRAKSNRCDIFEFLKPEFLNINYMLRDYDKVNSEDYSLNRCTILSDGFVPTSFKLRNPTPSAENDCGFAHIEIESHIYEITPPLVVIQNNDIPINCEAELPAQQYESIVTGLLTEFVSQSEKRKRSEPDCTEMLKEITMNQDLSNLNIANKRIKIASFRYKLQ